MLPGPNAARICHARGLCWLLATAAMSYSLLESIGWTSIETVTTVGLGDHVLPVVWYSNWTGSSPWSTKSHHAMAVRGGMISTNVAGTWSPFEAMSWSSWVKFVVHCVADEDLVVARVNVRSLE